MGNKKPWTQANRLGQNLYKYPEQVVVEMAQSLGFAPKNQREAERVIRRTIQQKQQAPQVRQLLEKARQLKEALTELLSKAIEAEIEPQQRWEWVPAPRPTSSTNFANFAIVEIFFVDGVYVVSFSESDDGCTFEDLAGPFEQYEQAADIAGMWVD